VAGDRRDAVRLHRAANLAVVRSSLVLAVVFAIVGRWTLSLAGAEVGLATVVIVSLVAAVLAIQSVFVGAARGMDRLTAATGVDLLLGRLLLALFLALAWQASWALGLSGALLALLAATGLSVAAGTAWVWGRDTLGLLSPTSDGEPVAGGDASTNPVLLVNHIVLFVAGVVGIWILHRSVGPEETGTFHLANRLALIAGIPGVVAQFLLGPRLARAAAGQTLESLAPTIRRHVRLATASTAGLAALLLAAGPALLDLVADGRLTQSVAQPMAVLLAGQLLHVVTGPCGYTLIMAGAERRTLVATVAGTAVTLAVGLAIIPGSGVMGAAVATVAGIAVTNLVNLFSLYRSLGITTLAGR
jgi:O-antigen/teichoic acid export membrane protein